jgi:hypothetical protein
MGMGVHLYASLNKPGIALEVHPSRKILALSHVEMV